MSITGAIAAARLVEYFNIPAPVGSAKFEIR
jgi:hypothetical protein